MDIIEIFKSLGSLGGLVILAGLFVWTYKQDRERSQEDRERNIRNDEKDREMLSSIDKSIGAINNTTAILKDYLIESNESSKRIEKKVDILVERGDKDVK